MRHDVLISCQDPAGHCRFELLCCSPPGNEAQERLVKLGLLLSSAPLFNWIPDLPSPPHVLLSISASYAAMPTFQECTRILKRWCPSTAHIQRVHASSKDFQLTVSLSGTSGDALLSELLSAIRISERSATTAARSAKFTYSWSHTDGSLAVSDDTACALHEV